MGVNIDPKYASYLYNKKIGNKSNLLREKLINARLSKVKKELSDDEMLNMNVSLYPTEPQKWEINKRSIQLLGKSAARVVGNSDYDEVVEDLIRKGYIVREDNKKKIGRVVL